MRSTQWRSRGGGRTALSRGGGATRALMGCLPAFLAAAAIAADAGDLRAQQSPRPGGTVVGLVTGDDDAALESAWVTVARSRIGTMSGPDGRFELGGVPVGPVVVEVRIIGYQTAYFDLTIVAGRTYEIRVELSPDPVRLEAIEGAAKSRMSPEMKGFHERRERGRGHFFTTDDIERMQPRLVTDVLRRVPNMRIEPGTGPQGGAEVARTQRTTGITGGRACPMLYFVNGMPFNIAAGATINAYIRPNEIAGMEVYMGASQIPPQFHLSQNNARCGLIVIWTHSGERRGSD